MLQSLYKKMKFSIKNFFTKYDQIRRSLIENFIFYAMNFLEFHPL